MKPDPSERREPEDVALPPELDALFASARAARPSPQERARVLSALGERATSPMRAPLSAGVKLGLALAALGLFAAGLWLARSLAEQPRAQTPEPPASVEISERAHVEPAQTRAQLEAPAPSPEPSAERGAAAPAPAEPGEARGPTSSERTAIAAPEPELPSEEDLIDRAQRSLPGAPDRCLRLLARHARLYPDGVLAQEREALSISALVQTREMPAARARLTRFERAWPSSPHLRRLRDLLASE